MAFTYRCSDYPGMEACPGLFAAETDAELWQHIQLHASLAHQEDPAKWSPEDRETMKNLIRIG